jgi:hypothetical protein
MTIHGAVVMDFLFIQPFGWIRIIIAWGRGFFVHSAVWLDSYHNRLGKKNPSSKFSDILMALLTTVKA